jgi:hypothetical protein
MRKRKHGATSISRDTPATPSPEKLPNKRVCIYLLHLQQEFSNRKGKHPVRIWLKSLFVISWLHFFCHNCNEWDTLSAEGGRKLKFHPASINCTASHESFIFPLEKLCGVWDVLKTSKRQPIVSPSPDVADDEALDNGSVKEVNSSNQDGRNASAELSEFDLQYSLLQLQ